MPTHHATCLISGRRRAAGVRCTDPAAVIVNMVNLMASTDCTRLQGETRTGSPASPGTDCSGGRLPPAQVVGKSMDNLEIAFADLRQNSAQRPGWYVSAADADQSTHVRLPAASVGRVGPQRPAPRGPPTTFKCSRPQADPQLAAAWCSSVR